MRRFVAYYRVSTDRQGRSGLGIEAQQATVQRHVNAAAGELVASFVEVESGSKADRPKLADALAACRAHRACLLVARLDRLSRDALFILSLLRDAGENGVAFCDLPQLPPGPAGQFVAGQLALVAQLERGLISQRTKAALHAAKARGVRLGGDRGGPRRSAADAAKAAEAAARKADAAAEVLRQMVNQMHAEGIVASAALARALNARGIAGPRGGQWHPSSAQRLVRRLRNKESPR